MIAAEEGFEHFDANQGETFAAALILLCLDEDSGFRSLVASLVHRAAPLAGGNSLASWGREAALDSGGGNRRRSDLWLRFPGETILVELKTHSNWKPISVVRQMTDQQKSQLNGTRVSNAVLLAPGALLRRMRAPAFPRISWQDFITGVEAIERPSRILELAVEHWSRIVERDFGLSATLGAPPFEVLAAQAACLVAFLRVALARAGGEARGDAVWFSSPDGRPRERRQWAWVGIAVPGQIPVIGRVYLGIYTYSSAPPGEPLGTFLEVYRLGDDDDALASIPFAPPDLSSDSLETVLQTLDAAWVRR